MDIGALFTPWFNYSIGKPINIDGAYGDQCVDVDLAWAEYLWPTVPWWQSIGYGDAKDLFNSASIYYFEKIPYKAGFIPQVGDIGIKAGTSGNPEGHTWVVMSANPTSMHVIQQNGYNPSGVAYEGDLSYNNVIGFLRPRIGGNMQGTRYDTVPTRDDIAAHYQKRMFRDATPAELANVDKLTWGQILDDNTTELGKRLQAAQNSTQSYTKDGVVAYIQKNLS